MEAAAVAAHTRYQVPILTQSEDWALFKTLKRDVNDVVPILTQSEDWAL